MSSTPSKNEKNTTMDPSARTLILLGATLTLVGCGLALFGDSEASGALWKPLWFVGVIALALGSVRLRKGRQGSSAGTPVPPSPVEKDAPAAAAEGSYATVEALVQRSEDVVATLRDLVEHGQASADYGMLPELLARCGLMGWEGAPKFGANRLRRNRRWWASCDVDELTDEGYWRLVALEGALNVAADLAEDPWPAGLAPEARVAEVFSRLADLRPLDVDGGPTLPEGERGGEWEARLALSEALEGTPAPFRVVSAFQLDLDEGVACVDVMAPAPSCLALVAPGDARAQADAARAYAWRLALLVAGEAFGASPRVQRACVNCVGRSGGDVLLSLMLDRGQLAPLRRAASRPGTPELPGRDVCRATVGKDGWLTPTEPFLRRGDGMLCPPGRWEAVELRPEDATPAVASACGASRVCDLGINENALRVSLWNGIVGELGSSTQDAVGRLMALRESTEDQGVRDACDRTCQTLVDGTADVTDPQALAVVFAAGDALSQASRRTAELIGDDPTPDDLARALDAALVPLAQAGSYADDEKTVYRYFNSAAERVRFNRSVADGRRVVLVPDAYYAAHSLAARILTLLDRAGEAMVHADELRRIAPVTVDAVLARVRVLEAQERLFECAEELSSAIGFAATAREASICLYRLAYMEWRLGRSTVAVACYERAIQLHGEIADQAHAELEELLASEEGLGALEAGEVVGALERAGIPAGDADGIRDEMTQAAAACVDAGLFGISRAYLAVAMETDRDDALLGVYRSLAAPSPEG